MEQIVAAAVSTHTSEPNLTQISTVTPIILLNNTAYLHYRFQDAKRS